MAGRRHAGWQGGRIVGQLSRNFFFFFFTSVSLEFETQRLRDRIVQINPPSFLFSIFPSRHHGEIIVRCHPSRYQRKKGARRLWAVFPLILSPPDANAASQSEPTKEETSPVSTPLSLFFTPLFFESIPGRRDGRRKRECSSSQILPPRGPFSSPPCSHRQKMLQEKLIKSEKSTRSGQSGSSFRPLSPFFQLTSSATIYSRGATRDQQYRLKEKLWTFVSLLPFPFFGYPSSSYIRRE